MNYDDLFGNWKDSDLDEYVSNKANAEYNYKLTGKWDLDLASRNEEIRNKYGMEKDTIGSDGITNLVGYRFDRVLYPALIDYGKNSEKENFKEIAYDLESKQEKYLESTKAESNGKVISTRPSNISSGNIGGGLLGAFTGTKSNNDTTALLVVLGFILLIFKR